MVVMPSVAVGSKIRFVERSLIELLGSDLTKTKSLGESFEQQTRKMVQTALTGNKIISDSCCLPHALNKANEGGEEIDLIIRIGKTIVVGELKCLIAPVEPVERYNHLAKLEHAADQAKRKANWLLKNLHLIKLLWRTEGHVSGLKLVPMVILNQRVGSGLKINDVIVTDVFLLKLFLGDGSYTSGAAISKGKKAIAFETMYTTQTEAEAQLERVFSSPPPLRPFLAGADWARMEFPVASGHIWIEVPKLKPNSLVRPDLEAVANLFSNDTRSFR